MAKAGYKRQPASWPTAPFILLKMLLALSSLVVLATMAFFSYHLRKDGYAIPWQFVTLAAVSAASFLSVFILGVFFCCRALNPIVSMLVDGFLWALWGVGGVALTKGMAPNLKKSCAMNQWANNKEGVMVCHMYKTLFSFVIIGWVALIGSWAVAIYARSRSGPKYVPANPKSLQTTSYKPSTTIGSTASDAPYGAGGTYKAEDGNPNYYS